ncbi:Tad domain-containing protein [Qipengyuania sp. SS22]|uniref:pilus assembly protein n=1 Tax=Qipengyuania sp. SS22 TaxID=2979461 RepID=UPI0021E5CD71|nr:TadE/TadG family type IV pilus assembly protein [Qipengyuania sp. SS22]UYH56196.1 Tad domain-containing protein [Qipengyuania sp. SS22]
MICMLRNLWNDTKGNTLAIFAAALIPLVVVIGSSLDLSFAYMAKAKLQNACDAAALAGRQSMDGNSWTDANEDEARKFFQFNFPDGTLGAQDLNFEIDTDPNDNAQIIGVANAVIPTSLMHIFGYDNVPIQANCDAKRDLGHNDVMLVLDTTGSMGGSPSTIGGKSKIRRLREGASGLYRALDDTENGSVTRFGMVSYSQTVNVAGSLRNDDILVEQLFYRKVWDQQVCSYRRSNGKWSETGCVTNTYLDRDDVPSDGWRGSGNNYTYTYEEETKYRDVPVHIEDSEWGRRSWSVDKNLTEFRTSGDGCIEERSSVGQPGSPFSLLQTISQADIDAVATNSNDTDLQWGRYDPSSGRNYGGAVCPGESIKLAIYGSEGAFNDAIDDVTDVVGGNTYHDIGMLWGARFLSPTGMFSSDNPTTRGSIPVNRHIVFMTDGEIATNRSIYTAYGVDSRHDRIGGSGSLNGKHIARFHATCNRAKASGTTIWVIALDVTAIEDIEDCATSAAHFYTSDGSDLEQIFETIGRGIGNLRLTR